MMENKKVIRHLDAPRTFGEWLHRYRFTIARRFVQFCILLAFIGTFRFGWKVLGHPLLAGDLSSSRIFDTVPLQIRSPHCSAWSLSTGFHRNP